MTNAFDACYDALRKEILSGQRSAGERLESERRLAERFAVNRVTVRSALGRLETSGLLEARRGSGWVVQDFRVAGGPDLIASLADLADDTDDLATDLLLVRRHMARAVLQRLASRPPSPEAVAEVARAVDAFAVAVAEGQETSRLAELDVGVLEALLAATGSPILGLFSNPITAALQRLPRLRDAIYADPEANVAGWRGLLYWLLSPDSVGVDTLVTVLESRDQDTLSALEVAP
jgi:DNA-binding FadR family transcriptional regulator